LLHCNNSINSRQLRSFKKGLVIIALPERTLSMISQRRVWEGKIDTVSKSSNSRQILSFIELLCLILESTGKAREFKMWKVVEGEKARGRQSALNGKTLLSENFHEAKTGRAADFAAQKTGFNRSLFGL
jgi:hypothetical protein